MKTTTWLDRLNERALMPLAGVTVEELHAPRAASVPPTVPRPTVEDRPLTEGEENRAAWQAARALGLPRGLLFPAGTWLGNRVCAIANAVIRLRDETLLPFSGRLMRASGWPPQIDYPNRLHDLDELSGTLAALRMQRRAA